MIRIIARRELLEWSRDGRVRWLAGSCVLVLWVVLMVGWQSTRAQIDLRQAVSERELDNFLGQGDKNPHAAAHFGQYAFRPTLIPAALIFWTFCGRQTRLLRAGASQPMTFKPRAWAIFSPLSTADRHRPLAA